MSHTTPDNVIRSARLVEMTVLLWLRPGVITSQSNVSPHSALLSLARTAGDSVFRLQSALIGRQPPAITSLTLIGPLELWMGLTLYQWCYLDFWLGCYWVCVDTIYGKGLTLLLLLILSSERDILTGILPSLIRPAVCRPVNINWQKIIRSSVLQRKTLFRVSQKTKDSIAPFSLLFPNNPLGLCRCKAKDLGNKQKLVKLCFEALYWKELLRYFIH